MFRYAITDRTLRPASSNGMAEALAAQAARLAHQCVNFLQLREKDLAPDDLIDIACRIRAELRGCGGQTRLLINGPLEVAIAVEADGVHLSSQPGHLTIAEVHAAYRAAGLPDPFVSVSCHHLHKVRQARDEGASAILFGPVFGKSVREIEVAPPIGLEALRLACLEAGSTPVLALGGVTPDRIPQCLQAGAAGIAAIRMFLDGGPAPA